MGMIDRLSRWLTRPVKNYKVLNVDLQRLCECLEMGDVVLMEGNTRISSIIRVFTQSRWTHSALYLGTREHLDNWRFMFPWISKQLDAMRPTDHVIIEALLHRGVVLRTIEQYASENMRICRHDRMTTQCQNRMLKYCLRRVGRPYDIATVIKMAVNGALRYNLMEIGPRNGHEMCASLIAKAYEEGGRPLRIPDYMRTCPEHFDYLPEFTIIKRY